MISKDKTIRYSQSRPNGELMISHRKWRWYQPNDHRTGDCVIRAYSKYHDIDWLSAFDILMPLARERKENLTLLFQYANGDIAGMKWHSLPAIKGRKRITVERFAKDHKEGRYILKVANHVVAVKDGYFWDIWDCGECCVYGYWTD